MNSEYLLKKKRLIPIIIVSILIFTNPSYEDSKAIKGYGLNRDINLFVCSFWSEGDNKYVGFLGNFIQYEKEAVSKVKR